jgi:acyl carrier protein
MEHASIQTLVFDALNLTNQSREESAQIPISADTELFGNNGCLDSMALVALLIDIEDLLLDEGVTVSLSDERAMSATNSPFRSVQTLVNYITELTKEG